MSHVPILFDRGGCSPGIQMLLLHGTSSIATAETKLWCGSPTCRDVMHIALATDSVPAVFIEMDALLIVSDPFDQG